MASHKQQQNAKENNCGSSAPVGPCGYIYVYPRSEFPAKEATLLSDGHAGASVFSLPLLYNLTVESGFPTTVKAVHRKLDLATLSVKVSSYHAQAMVFHNPGAITSLFSGHGLRQFCDGARTLFGYGAFAPPGGYDPETTETDPREFLPPGSGPDALNEHLMAVVVTEVFKERLFAGELVPVPSLSSTVQVGPMKRVFRFPLYDSSLFGPSCKLTKFYRLELSRYMFESLYTPMAQALRMRDVGGLIRAAESQAMGEQYKMAKISELKDYPVALAKQGDAASMMAVEAAATELAVSYALAFLEAPQEPSPMLDYDSWPLFTGCSTEDDRLAALTRWNAQLAIHVHAQLFSTNSMLYLTQLGRQSQTPAFKSASDAQGFNSFFLQHGLGYLSEATQLETGEQAFHGVPSGGPLDGGAYVAEHLAYAAGFSPHLLARMCYYLQFCQHQRSSANSSFNVAHYVQTASTPGLCDICAGATPGSCVRTLVYRLQDRFPPVLAQPRRDPYVITGATSLYNDLEPLGNFASFRERDDDTAQNPEASAYTYWQLNQTLTERLEALGVREAPPAGPYSNHTVIDSDARAASGATCGAGMGSNATEAQAKKVDVANWQVQMLVAPTVPPAPETQVSSVAAFIKLFKDIDAAVDAEVLKFIASLTKNNVNYRETVKGVHHVIMYNCNVFWQAPCSVLLRLFYRTVMTVVQDLSLPVCMQYERENPAAGQLPSEWLRLHFQTLYTNFKNSCFDRGAITGGELKVTHDEMFCDFFDLDAAQKGSVCPTKMQVRLSRALVATPRVFKVKNRIVFSNSGAAESIQQGFLRTTPGATGTGGAEGRGNVVTGPYMPFLNAFHRQMFPETRVSALYMWTTFSQRRQLPALPGVSRQELVDLANFVEAGTRAYEEANMLDAQAETLMGYAKQRLNNAILRACGQTQFYATTISCLCPRIQTMPAVEYPHALGARAAATPEAYHRALTERVVCTVHTTQRENIARMGRMRPLVTVPVVVNKYTGINGNNQIFHCGNLGYFMGRGVDKNLLTDSGFTRRQAGGGSHMRRRHVFMTPMVDNLLKHSPGSASVPFEIENVRRAVQQVLSDHAEALDPALHVVLELVKHMGEGCRLLSVDDMEFMLGRQYCILAEQVTDALFRLKVANGPWTPEGAEAAYYAWSTQARPDENMEFISFDEPGATGGNAAGGCVAQEFLMAQPPTATPQATRKRKMGSILSDADL
ncbi:Viral DNA binding protein [Eptesicus fuscus gammaherpesvirus]|uniref:Viral DNA binding protein n=1 Tax=vespertilionid gammaherpesvirus 3 TaxID=2846598 RepID=A0A2D1A8Q1_9GAMA|nr:Viral DNA binding protein [Eptesicus fuscus gammaherpesvirus]ATA58238.1 Viral DNA binding protein [Eptesicus fuscus gammaherpesvirus]WAH70943.1 major DNA-binding protein [Eptesicus fuscus gammaherpesvirus]